ALARDELPDLRQISRDPRFFPYRWGHAFWSYVGGRFNDRTVGRLFTRGVALGLDVALQETLGLDDKDFSELWKASIREAYAPVLETRQTPKTLGARLLPREEESTDTYIAPVISPDGTEVIFFSTRRLFTFDLYLADARTGEIKAKLLSADADAHFDSLRFLDSAGSWSPDGKRFAFAVFAGGDNELAILDVRSRNVERRYEVEGVGAIWNPAWSPDGRSIVFSGSAGGISDLYLLDVASGQTRKLTDDRFADLQPEWSPDGRTIAFVSDRGAGTDLTRLAEGPMTIWALTVDGGQVRELVPLGQEPGHRINPQYGPGGKDLFFLSDVAGVSDLYRMDVASGEIFRVTHLTTGVTGIARLSPAMTVSEGTGRVMFSVFHDTTYQIHGLDAEQARGVPIGPDPMPFARVADLPPQRERAASVVAQYLGEPQALESARAGELDTEEYRPKLSLDFVGPAVGVGVSTTGTAFGGDITAFFSDVLNQREVGFTLYGGSGSSFNEFGAEAYYLNQASRLQWGGAAGHVPYISAFTTARNEVVEIDGELFEARVIEQIRETILQDQVAVISRFPFSATRRLEASVGYTRLDFQAELFRVAVIGDTVIERTERDLPSPESLSLVQGSLAFVGDNSYFGFTSPVRGQRYRFEIQPTFGDLNFESLLADYRRYFFKR
ncbi:MAG TPA: peptidase S9, partial [Thermoanaerobaculia bacterium]